MLRRLLVWTVLLAGCLALAAPPMTKLTIAVKSGGGKPVDNASVIVKFIQGHDLMKLGRGVRYEWELRTGQEGTVKVPAIPQGKILIQVIAKNYQTFGETFEVADAEKTIDIKLNPPQAQYSAH